MSALELTHEEVRHFLAREPLDELTRESDQALRNRRVLVTGGGGSLGSLVARSALQSGATAVAAADRAEGGLFALEGRPDVDARLETFVVDVAVPRSCERLFARWRPDIVIHAAAHKHVPLMERHPAEAARNNVFGSRTVLDACRRAEVSTCLLVSTDKAVDPTAVMGASKRCAERLWLGSPPEPGLRRLAVRLPNLLGSAGSVLVRFLEQARAGSELTITDEVAERFFVTAREGAGFVSRVLEIGQDGELLALLPKTPTRIVDLAQRVLEYTGRPATACRLVGLRPGDRLQESLWEKGAAFEPVESVPGVFRRRALGVDRELIRDLTALEEVVKGNDEDDVRRTLIACAQGR